MKKQWFCLSIFLLLSSVLAPPVVSNTTQRIQNTNTPRDNHQVLHPRELWRYGRESDDILFGFIITAEIDANGSVYLLDRWLGTVHVLGSNGDFLHQLSREGEGPGETKQPTDLTWLPNGELGITQPLPGRLVRIDQAGNPKGNLVPEVVSAHEAQFGILTEINWRGGTLACCGSQTDFREGQLEVSSFLSVCDFNTGAEIAPILDNQSSDDGRMTLREADQYWINEGRWCLSPDGNIYVAPQRDAYTIHVYSPKGSLQQVIERDYEPRHRTAGEIMALQKRWFRPENEWGGGREVQISETDPCITDLRVAGNGELWVRHSRSNRAQAPGVFAAWDVFAADGTYSRVVSVEIAGDPDNDQLFFLGDDHLLLIRGYHEASDAMWGQGETEEQEIIGEIVFYDLAP